MSSRSGTPKDADVHADVRLADFLEQYIGKYIALADTKAGLMVGVTGGILAYLLTEAWYVEALKAGEVPLSLCAWVAASALAVSALFSFWVVWPRRATSREGIIFWRSIAQFPTADHFADRVRGSSQQQIANDRLVHCYDVAQACSDKYDVLALSMPIGLVGVVAAFATLLMA